MNKSVAIEEDAICAGHWVDRRDIWYIHNDTSNNNNSQIHNNITLHLKWHVESSSVIIYPWYMFLCCLPTIFVPLISPSLSVSTCIQFIYIIYRESMPLMRSTSFRVNCPHLVCVELCYPILVISCILIQHVVITIAGTYTHILA